MKLLPLQRLGAVEISSTEVYFGFPLPWVSAVHGARLFVKIIHQQDQFLQRVHPKRFELHHAVDGELGDFWSGNIIIQAVAGDDSHWGKEGRYLYRYELESPLLPEPLDWIVDPFAREYGAGRMSGFTLGYEAYVWSADEGGWKTPQLQDLIVYEVMLHEFAYGVDGLIDKLAYLQDLGINCMEVMPVSNVHRSVDWGFEPIGFFGVDERFGNRKEMQRLIDLAHQHGIAVMLDMIYGHTGEHFAYEYVYKNLKCHDNPLMAAFGDMDAFGASVDYRQPFAQDLFFTANMHWLDCYHADGIRYDCVPNYYDGTAGVGYANLVYQTYRHIKREQNETKWQRFFDQGAFNLIQCAEQLEKPKEMLHSTYSNSTWQNETLSSFGRVASGDHEGLEALGFHLGASGYPVEVNHDGEWIRKAPMHYLENHDHPRFICHFGKNSLFDIRCENDPGRTHPAIEEGDRSQWYHMPPYIAGLLTARGIPLLWEGQELLENYDLPDSGMARIGIPRPVRWERFYDEPGREAIRLYRRLLQLRRDIPALRRGNYFFHNHWQQWLSRGLLLFSRELEGDYLLIALNFSALRQQSSFWFPLHGDYLETIEGQEHLAGVEAYQEQAITLPAHGACIWRWNG